MGGDWVGGLSEEETLGRGLNGASVGTECQRGGGCEGSEGGHAASVKKFRSPVWLEWRMKWTVVRNGGLEVSSGPVLRPWPHGRDLGFILTWENPLEAP